MPPAIPPASSAAKRIRRDRARARLAAGTQWQGKAKECRLSWAALWIVVEPAKPTPKTMKAPSRRAARAGPTACERASLREAGVREDAVNEIVLIMYTPTVNSANRQ